MNLTRSIREVIGIAVLEAIWIVRQPAWLIQSALLAISLAVLFWVWGGARGLGYAISGWIISTAFSTGVNIMGQNIGWNRTSRILDLFIASPITPKIYFAGSLISSLVWFLNNTVIFVIIGLLTGQLPTVIYSLVASLLVTPTGILLGLSIAFYIKKPTNISAITNPISSILSFLPPVFYPASALPEPLGLILCLAPTAAGAELARALSGIGSQHSPLLLAVTLAAWASILAITSNRIIRWSLE